MKCSGLVSSHIPPTLMISDCLSSPEGWSPCIPTWVPDKTLRFAGIISLYASPGELLFFYDKFTPAKKAAAENPVFLKQKNKSFEDGGQRDKAIQEGREFAEMNFSFHCQIIISPVDYWSVSFVMWCVCKRNNFSFATAKLSSSWAHQLNT